MRVHVTTTLEGSLTLELADGDRVGTLRERLGAVGRFQRVPSAQIRILKDGEYLDNNALLLSEAGITDDSTVVAFISKYGVEEDPMDMLEANVLQPVVDGLKPIDRKPSRGSGQRLFASQSSEFMRHGSGGYNYNRPMDIPVAEKELDDAKGTAINPEALDTLLKMGFDKALSEMALQVCEGDVSAAVEFIVTNGSIGGELLPPQHAHPISQHPKQKNTKKEVSSSGSGSNTNTNDNNNNNNNNGNTSGNTKGQHNTTQSPSAVHAVAVNNDILHPLAATLSPTERESIVTISALTGIPASHVCSVFFASGRNADSTCELLMRDVEEMGDCGQMKNVVHFNNMGPFIDNDIYENGNYNYNFNFNDNDNDNDEEDDNNNNNINNININANNNGLPNTGMENEEGHDSVHYDTIGTIENPDFEPK